MKEIEVSELELLNSIKDNRDGENCRYAFLLGAGASVTSKIPAAKDMAEEWLKQIKESNTKKYESLKGLKGFNEDNLAAFYPQIYQARFGAFPEDGYEAIERYMSSDQVNPSIGYSILAQILNKTSHNVVLTTNFDRLTEAALLDFENVHARVIAHESMLNVLSVHDRKPSIIKIHRDMIFSPISTKEEICDLDNKWKAVIERLFSNYKVIVLGYGGNDGGLMSIIENVLSKNQQAKLYWCYRNNDKPKPLEKLLNKQANKVFPVSVTGFDEFMFQLREKLDFELYTNAFEQNANKRKLEYERQLTALTESKEETPEHSQAVQKLLSGTWWEVQQEINTTDSEDKKEELYLQGIEQLPKSYQLIGNYALFLKNIRKDYDGAESYYQKALKLEPEHANNIGNYATFLQNIKKDYDGAEKYYQKALKLEPEPANNNGNYAIFLENIEKNYEKADKYYQKALTLDPDSTKKNVNYALFNELRLRDYDKAQNYYRRALELEPDNAKSNVYYASFLNYIRKDYDGAEEYYLKARSLEPNNVEITVSYAAFLKTARKEFDKALQYYQKLLELEPNVGDLNGNYAQILLEQGKKKESLPFLIKAEKVEDNLGLKLELAFYRLALFPETAEQSREVIYRLLDEGVTSSGWDFSGIIAQAEKEGCEYIDELKELAERISKV